jgi:hypothetical protein
MIEKFLLLTLFGTAMAHVEGVVVVYLRKALGVLEPASTTEILGEFNKHYINIERTREAATIVMLITLSLLVGETLLEKLVIFLWTFAIWDLFYYVSLYVLIKWPPNLTTTDVLFLIPRPWIAPVWIPIGISLAVIILIIIFYILRFL